MTRACAPLARHLDVTDVHGSPHGRVLVQVLHVATDVGVVAQEAPAWKGEESEAQRGGSLSGEDSGRFPFVAAVQNSLVGLEVNHVDRVEADERLEEPHCGDSNESRSRRARSPTCGQFSRRSTLQDTRSSRVVALELVRSTQAHGCFHADLSARLCRSPSASVRVWPTR